MEQTTRTKRVALYKGKHYKVIAVKRFDGVFKVKLGFFNSDKTFVVPLDWIKFAGTQDEYTATGWKNKHYQTARIKVHRTNHRRGINK